MFSSLRLAQNVQRIKNILIPEHRVILGRWHLKHDAKKCDKYICNYYAEPGYPNRFKKTNIIKNN
tara:strand:+ start:426 stop:620 length:195 start_codon:yes stop_codon:yes gene_type:complete